MTKVVIRGDGVAARCCAHLLAGAGISIARQAESRPRLPAILLGGAAQRLIGDIFARPDLFDGLPRIERRMVAWDPKSAPVTVDHSAVVISEEALLDRLGDSATASDGSAQWTIHASPPLPDTTEQRFGSRAARATPVELRDTAEANTCWIESLGDGWLFLIATRPSAGWLLSVGLRPETLLERSRLIATRIGRAQPSETEFLASPRIVSPLAGPAWIACGSAAMAFDPICGDGAAHAVREAILAAAVVRAAARGDDAEGLRAHYETRLIGAMQRHLAHCLEYYRTGFGGAWWQAEAEATLRGIAWCTGRVGSHPKFRYRLNGLDLEAAE